MSKKDRVLISILATMMLNTSTFSLFASADNTANTANTDNNSVTQSDAASSDAPDAEAELDAWMEGREKPTISVNGDFVMNKNQQFKE